MTTTEVRKSHGTSIRPGPSNRDLLAAMAVHELKEPVHAVQSFLSVILQGRTGPLNEAQTDFLSTASQATRRIVRRLEDFRLVFSDQAPFNLDCQEVDLFQHLHSCIQELRVLSEIHGVRLHLRERASRNIAPTCWADPDRFDQMLLNILENAIRYSIPDTDVNIFVRETSSGAMAIIVQNTSDSETLGNVDQWFGPFWREDDHHPSAPNGMGLGLSIVDHLVRAHGGALEAYVREQRIYIGFALPTRIDLSANASEQKNAIIPTVTGVAANGHEGVNIETRILTD